MHERIAGPELDEPLVDVKAFSVAALESQVVALDAKHIDVFGMAVENARKELDLKIQLRLIGSFDERVAGGQWLGPRRLSLAGHGKPLWQRGGRSQLRLHYSGSP